MIALIMFTRRSDIMGTFANGKLTNVVAIAGTVGVLLLNLLLILQTFGLPVPGLWSVG